MRGEKVCDGDLPFRREQASVSAAQADEVLKQYTQDNDSGWHDSAAVCTKIFFGKQCVEVLHVLLLGEPFVEGGRVAI